MRIGIVGSGISGLGAAYILSEAHEVTLYEKSDSFGGHSRTVDVKTEDGVVPVDTGFLVFNHHNYPNLVSLFERLEVPTAKSSMSFGVSIGYGSFEYVISPMSMAYLSAQLPHLLRFRYWQMLKDMVRFNSLSGVYREKKDMTVEEMLKDLGLGEWFRNYYLLALSQGIWSSLSSKILDFPAHMLVTFFDNHLLTNSWKSLQWYTVKGGSREYVKRIVEGSRCIFRKGLGVERVEREEGGVRVYDSKGGDALYDHVILASHSDQSLRMNVKSTRREEELLGKIRYGGNEAVLHSDERMMPRDRRCWASWVYTSEGKGWDSARSFSYWLNNLQPCETRTPLIETLNPSRPVREEYVYGRHYFEHPLFDKGALEAQGRLGEIQGEGGVWYCGAWQGYGFHEDGLKSAVEVSEKLGVKAPWLR